MSMDSVVDLFFNLPTLIMCLGIYLITYLIRTIIETYWENSKDNKFWNHIFLPLGAICNGMIIGYFAKLFPWPMAIGASATGRVMFGGIAGMMSGFVYNRVKAWVNDNTKNGSS